MPRLVGYLNRAEAALVWRGCRAEQLTSQHERDLLAVEDLREQRSDRCERDRLPLCNVETSPERSPVVWRKGDRKKTPIGAERVEVERPRQIVGRPGTAHRGI